MRPFRQGFVTLFIANTPGSTRQKATARPSKTAVSVESHRPPHDDGSLVNHILVCIAVDGVPIFREVAKPWGEAAFVERLWSPEPSNPPGTTKTASLVWSWCHTVSLIALSDTNGSNEGLSPHNRPSLAGRP
jgi:hypothetical protein